MARGTPGDAAKVMRTVRVDTAAGQSLKGTAKKVTMLARANAKGVPGTWSRSQITIGPGRSAQGQFAGGVEITGTLALVGEYGMTNRSWSNWHGGRVQRSQIPPGRIVKGRPKPDDGYILGKAWKQARKEATKDAADAAWSAYQVQFDKAGVYTIKAGSF